MFSYLRVILVVVSILQIRNYSVCTSSVESRIQSSCIVDLLTIITKPHEYAYISKGDFWLSLHLMQTLTSLKNRSTFINDSTICLTHHLRLHIFTDTRWIIDYGKELGYHMYNISSLNEGFKVADDFFMEMYRPNHHSINTVEYEYLCFFRWHLFRIVVDNWQDHHAPISRIITMDSDAIITTDAFTLYNNLYHSLDFNSENDFELIVVTPGAFHLWSVHGLKAYSNFIYSWYNASVDTILANTKNVAGYLYGRLHFSDMQMVEVFAARNSSVRNMRYAQAALHNNWQRNQKDDQLIRRLGCLPMNRYSDMMVNNSFRISLSTQSSTDVIFGQYEQVPFCFMHFQGDGIKGLLKVFSKFLLMVSSNISHHSESNYVDHSIQVVKNAVITQDGHQNQRHSHHAHHGLNPSPCLAQLLIEPLLMIRRRSKDIFLLTIEPQHHHPLLRRIANFNSFLALNFSLKQVVHNVPSEVLQMFPLGPDINCC